MGYKCQQKKKKDSPALITSIHQYKHSMNTLKRAKTELLQQPLTAMATSIEKAKTRKQKCQEKNFEYFKRPRVLKRKLIIQNRTASVDY